MQAIQATIKNEEDVDRARVTFSPNLSHCYCLGVDGFSSILFKQGGKGWFSTTTYFHPNVREDGWEELKLMHEDARRKFDEEKRTFQMKEELKSQKKNKGKGKKKATEADKTREENKLKYNQDFRPFPDEPVFWDSPVTGSEISLWPPRLFNPWIEAAKAGKKLSLDPALPVGFVAKEKFDPLPTPPRFVTSTNPSSQPLSQTHRPPSPANALAGPSHGARFESLYGSHVEVVASPARHSESDNPPPAQLVSGNAPAPQSQSDNPPSAQSGAPSPGNLAIEQVQTSLVPPAESSEEFDNFGLSDDQLAAANLDVMME